MTVRLIGCVLAALSCGADAPALRVPAGDLDEFARSVQPVLAAGCADTGCHGRPGRPLQLYAPGRLRRDPSDVILDAPLDEDELRANARRLAALAVASGPGPERSLPLCKPLAVAEGGCGHRGGAVFASIDDAGYRALRAWIQALGITP